MPITNETKNFEWVNLKRQHDDFHEVARSDITYHTSTLVGGRVFMIGRLSATNHSRQTNNCCYFDVAKLEWVWLEVLGPAFGGHQAILVDDAIFLYGNGTTAAQAKERLWKLDLVGLEWTTVVLKTPLPVSQKGCACAFVEDSRELVSFGGFSPNGFTDVLLFLHVDTMNWYRPKQTGAVPCARSAHATCSVSTQEETTVFIYGGFNEDMYFNDLYMLHVRAGACRWSKPQVHDVCPPVAYPSITYVDGRVFLFGGFNSDLDDTNVLVVYDRDRRRWQKITGASAGEYHVKGVVQSNSVHRAVSCHRGILFFGGFNREYPWVDMLCAEKH